MRAFIFTLLFPLVLFAQSYDPLVLKDGRTIATKGAYSIDGDRVIYTSPEDDLIAIPLDKVDLATTERYRELKKKVGPEQKAPTSLAEKIKVYKKEHGLEDATDRERGAVSYVAGTEPVRDADGNLITDDRTAAQVQKSETKALGQSTTVEKAEAPDWLPPEVGDKIMDRVGPQSEAMEAYRKLMDGPMMLLAVAFLIAAAILALLAMLTHIYLSLSSFRDGVSWGIALLVTLTAPFWTLPFHFLFNSIAVGFIANVLSLAHYVLIVAYIINYRHGSRARYLFLIFAPPTLGILTLIGLLIANIF